MLISKLKNEFSFYIKHLPNIETFIFIIIDCQLIELFTLAFFDLFHLYSV
nr:MAG TPA_asm: hypothetical protein [Caudoviricetes sp.]